MTLVTYNGLQVPSPDPTGDGGLAIAKNFKAVSTNLATTAPTGGDNTKAVLSRWIDTTASKEWVCTDVTSGVAIWLSLSDFVPLSGGTISGNVIITGSLDATTLSGDGSAITNIDAASITTNVIATARLGSGTASSSTFLRGDGSWAGISTSNISGLGTIATHAASDYLPITGGTVTGTITANAVVTNTAFFAASDTYTNATGIILGTVVPSYIYQDLGNQIRIDAGSSFQFQTDGFRLITSGTGILGHNNGFVLKVQDVGGSPNYFQVENVSTGNAPSLTIVGGDTNIDVNIKPKGTGYVNFTGGLKINETVVIKSDGSLQYDNGNAMTDSSSNLMYPSGTVLTDSDSITLYDPAGNVLANDTGDRYYGSGALWADQNQIYYADGQALTKLGGGLVLLNLVTAPSSPVFGQVYANTTDKHAYFWNGTAWKQLDN
jgi:hypothetical protein